MSESALAAEACPNCGGDLPPAARFCPACGVQVDGSSTVRAEVPPDETGQVPVTFDRVEPNWYGVTPPRLLLATALSAIVVAVILFATGHWPYGLIMLGVGALLLAAFLEAVRRRPQSTLSRASVDARERALSGWETFRARSAATIEVRRIRNALAVLDSERRGALHDLGAAVHAGDGEAEERARERLAELDRREVVLGTRLEKALAEAGERIRKARLPVEETMMVLPQEPTPPPDEATPPQPAVVPEPYPPPDEATPPQPAQVPEPEPDTRDD
jgi:hypothetical protein